jgi:regulatory protein YycH of two-component signal transduction system YycFG
MYYFAVLPKEIVTLIISGMDFVLYWKFCYLLWQFALDANNLNKHCKNLRSKISSTTTDQRDLVNSREGIATYNMVRP